MKVLLVCAGGMSTSMLMKKMEKYAAEKGIADFSIDATGVGDLKKAADAEIILLGPQISYQEKNVRKKVGDDKPLAVIPMADYGRGNCDNIFKLINETLA